MNAELLIKARKVLVKEPIVEYSETCPYCAANGIDNKLRYYYISLEEAIYKCAGSSCLYPFERFIFKSLIDNSVYYYEEVFEGGREAIFRVPLDDQPMYQSTTPLSTKLFCDSQRNPNIESYDCDLSDLLNDLEPAPEPEEDKPQPESNAVNPDFFEFLDDIMPADFNTDKVLDENGVDDLIDNLLKDSPAKNVTPVKSVKAESGKRSKAVASKAKSEAKLSKCIQHIEKAKSTKSPKTKEKSTESFSVAIRKARKSQSKVKVEESPVKTEPEPEQKPVKLKPQQALATKSFTTALKSANILRPTALAKQLSSIDFTKINSGFLRRYMKAKEDKLFEGEPSNFEMGNENGVPKSLERTAPKQSKTGARCETVTSASMAENMTAKPKVASSKMEINKERPTEMTKGEKSSVKKGKKEKELSKSKATKKDAKAVKVKEEKSRKHSEPGSFEAPKQELARKTKVKEEKPPRKRTTSKKKDTEQKMADGEMKSADEKGSEKGPVKKNAQKHITLTVTSDNSTTESKTKSKKRSYIKKPKADDSTVIGEDGASKPKRRRTTKSTKHVDEDDIMSLPIILVTDTESESKSKSTEFEPILNQNCNPAVLSHANSESNVNFATAENGNSNQKCLKSVQSLISDDSESSQLESLHGFPPSVANVTSRMISVEMAPAPAMASPAQKSTKKRPIYKHPKADKIIKVEPEDDSNESGSSKRSRKTSSKPKAEKLPKPKRASKSQKDIALKTKSKIDWVAELPDLSDPNEAKENLQQEFAFGLLIETDNAIEYKPTVPDAPNEATAVATEAAKGTEDILAEETNRIETKETKEIATKEIFLAASFVKQEKPPKSTGELQQPYIRKIKVKRAEDKKSQIDKIIADWDDSESEQANDQQMATEGDSNVVEGDDSQEFDDVASVISITSENSDSVSAFGGDFGH
ncbi:microtubule-associated protein futsch-like [Sitodiplosis mosellana]|uniref:microtubule-associated protein futsch-like n=1 Tax=Sitodiplosis mosellana TaxID=263140 RepID=UPI002443F2C3|nr:microtubule-associated protein futsch-like [Sitodiplosis mosellana]